jgi:arylsulfatase A-like enzyme
MVRTERYKYVYCPEDHDELYDLKADPDELHNLVDDADQQAIRGRMRERLMRWMLDTADVLPMETDNRNWR